MGKNDDDIYPGLLIAIFAIFAFGYIIGNDCCDDCHQGKAVNIAPKTCDDYCRYADLGPAIPDHSFGNNTCLCETKCTTLRGTESAVICSGERTIINVYDGKRR